MTPGDHCIFRLNECKFTAIKCLMTEVAISIYIYTASLEHYFRDVYHILFSSKEQSVFNILLAKSFLGLSNQS